MQHDEQQIPADRLSIADLPPLEQKSAKKGSNSLSLSLAAMLANDIDVPRRPNPLLKGDNEPPQQPPSLYDKLPPIHKKGYKAPKVVADLDDDFDDVRL